MSKIFCIFAVEIHSGEIFILNQGSWWGCRNCDGMATDRIWSSYGLAIV